MPAVDLDALAADAQRQLETLRIADQPYGTYRLGPAAPPGFYATTDAAIIRWVIGEDLTALPAEHRDAWADVINAHQNPLDGRFGPEMGHHVLHANGMATNALAALGRRYRHPVRFYDLFNTPERIGPWLSQIAWWDPWAASHLVWGGPVLWSNSRRATSAWRDACLTWFAQQLNEFGGWPRDFETHSKCPFAPLGNAVHIWPLYRHRDLPVPGLETLADFTVDWQNADAVWDGVGRYGSMDAIYVLAVAIEADLPNADDYRDSVWRYFQKHIHEPPDIWQHLHDALAWLSCIGYLHRALPDEFAGQRDWRDIFDHPALYDLDTVLLEDSGGTHA